ALHRKRSRRPSKVASKNRKQPLFIPTRYTFQKFPPVGYALFDPGKTGTPPGTSTSTILTFAVTVGWSDPSCTTLVPATRSVMGMVTAKVRHVLVIISG